MDAITKNFIKRIEAMWKSFLTFNDLVFAKRIIRACNHF